MATRSQSKPDTQLRRKRFKIAAMVVLSVLAVVFAALAPRLAQLGITELAFRTKSWRCEQIQVVAGAELSADSLLKIAGIEPNYPLAAYSTSQIAERLLRSPWIATAQVTRRPPNVIEVRVTERTGVALLNDGSNLAVSSDLYLLPADGKPWANALPWLSVNQPFGRSAGPMLQSDPLFAVARQYANVLAVAPDVARNIAEMYRIDGTWGAVLLDPVLSISLAPDISAENWLAFDRLLHDGSFRNKIDSNAVVDLRLPGFVTLHLPVKQAEES
ncbi:MAG: FtsQ-type POTRA domain-containing protein [bacterium]|nr:FtsQ-type POTRA domain-containing protein [bacterium]